MNFLLKSLAFLGLATVFVVSSLIVFVAAEPAEPSWVVWSKTFGGTSYDAAYSLVKTSDGGYALAGNTWSFGTDGSSDFWLIKTDSSGNMEWNKTYGGMGYDGANSLVQTSDGGYALAGETESSGAGLGDFLLVKTDSNGNMEWNMTYGGIRREEAYSLVQTSDGGYILAGYTYSFGNPQEGILLERDAWVVKTDGSGNVQWNRTYGGTGDDWAHSIAQTSDGGYAVAGRNWSSGVDDSSDFWLIKTDANGNVIWNHTYGGAGNDRAYSLINTSDGGYALTGISNSVTPESSFWLVKTDSLGNMEWNQTYGQEAGANALVQTSDGGYALTGGTSSLGFGNSDVWLVKTDGLGNMEWNHVYGGERNDVANALVENSDGGYTLAGSTESFGVVSENVWLIRTNGLGVPEFPSWMILPLLLTATLIAVLARRRLNKKRASKRI